MFISITLGGGSEVVLHIYNGILLSHKRNKGESVELRWMNLEPVVQSEVSQKERKKHRILIHIQEF